MDQTNNYELARDAQLCIFSRKELRFMEEQAVRAKHYILAHKLHCLLAGDFFVEAGKRHDTADHAIRFAASLHTYMYSCEDDV